MTPDAETRYSLYDATTLKETPKSSHPSVQPTFQSAELPTLPHVVVIGGGLCGLVSAYTLQEAGVRVTLLESRERLGGNIATDAFGEYLCEAGPNSFLSSAHELLCLLEALRLRPLAASPSAKHRYITLGTSLIPVPMDPLSFLASPLLSLKAKWRLLQEPWIPPYRGKEEETVAQFITRRLGPELHSRLVQPFLTGVYAGDSHQLSAQSVLPRLVEWEAQHGSIVKGALYAVFQKRTRPRSKMKAALQRRGHTLLNFPEGMAQLVHRLANVIGSPSIRLQSPVDHVTYNADPAHGQAWRIQCRSGEKIEADALVMATPAYVTADILRSLAPEVAKHLAQIEYAPIHVVYQAFALKDVQKKRRGFGTLRCWERENPFQSAWLGSLWPSSFFPERAKKGHLLISHFFGGALHSEVQLWDDARCIREATLQSQWMLQLLPKAKADLNVVYPYMKGIPQYNRGHAKRIHAIESTLEEAFAGRLQLTGNYLSGISLNHCVISAQKTAQAILKSLSS
jgi:oxygen-dependent protoporphyrinogen oxidase